MLFAKKGYNGVGVAEIGAASGFGRGALYHHIESKEAWFSLAIGLRRSFQILFNV